MNIIFGIMIPLLGTVFGSSMVFLMRKEMNEKIQKILLGFASGVMIAASIFSLLIPSIEMAEKQGRIAWIPSSIGFLVGMLFLLLIDHCVFKFLEKVKKLPQKSRIRKNTMLMLAVTLHNIPEGMAVGVIFSGYLIGETGITLALAFALAIGIAIQNFPEGAIISMPLKGEGMSKIKSFLCGALSGIVEPLGAFITIALTSIVVPILPYLLSFSAGAMIYVVAGELIPESQQGSHSNIGMIGIAIGFILMMILDLTLG